MIDILCVGGADTGRAPMMAALLQRLANQRGLRWQVGSAGVLGHDGAPAETEARDAMLSIGLDIADHRARSLDDEMARATLLIATDRGTRRVIEGRFSGVRVHTLGDLAGRQRDIPDPFRMQIGAWISYAREMESMLVGALAQISGIIGEHPALAEVPETDQRTALVTRLVRLLDVALDFPQAMVWVEVRHAVEQALEPLGHPREASDLAPAYAGILRAALALTPTPPQPGHLAALRAAIARAEQPTAQEDIGWLSAQLATWGT